MTSKEILLQLEEFGTAQNRKIYKRHGAAEPMFGVSFANLKKLKRGIVSSQGKKGVNHELSLTLWDTGNMDAQTFAALIAEPQKLSRKILDAWINATRYYMLVDLVADVAAKSPDAKLLMSEWMNSEEEFKKRAGFSILNFFAREDDSLPDDFFIPHVEIIKETIQSSLNRSKEGMNNCLIAIGGRNETLRELVLEAAKEIGKVEIDHGETSCKTFVIEDYVAKIWARKKKK